MEMESFCYMDHLPDELLLLVLGYLNTFDAVVASHVCRRWRRIVSSHTLLVRRPSDARYANTTHRQIFISARGANLPTILSATRNLHSLIVHERVRFNTSMLTTLQGFPLLAHLDVFSENSRLNPEVIPAAQRLRTLVLNDLVVKNSVLQALVQSSHLVQLHMFGYARYYSPRTMVALIVSRQQHLTELTLRCQAIREFGYQEISHCSNLVALRLYSCQMLRAETAVTLISSLSKLRVLHLTGTTMLWKKPLRDMIEVLPKSLEELSLSASAFDDDHIIPLVNRLPILSVLELWLTPISTEGLVDLALSLQKLQEFDVDKIFTLHQLRDLVAHPSLIKLRCSRPSNMWNNEFQMVVGRLAPVATPRAQYGSSAFRSDGDGFRGILFYHWLIDHPPRPLSYGESRHADNSDYDDDYSLLGPEIMSCSSDLKRSYEDAGLEDPVDFSR